MVSTSYPKKRRRRRKGRKKKTKKQILSDKIRKLTEYKIWRTSVYARDLYTCQHCGKMNTYFNADHIVPLSYIIKTNDIKTIKEAKACEELWDVNNGRTLCVKCHKKTDTYGFKAKDYKKDGHN